MRRRPNSLPLFWRPVAGKQGNLGYVRFRDWLLVLNACGIPHKTITMFGREYIYVPPLLEALALHELKEFARERATPEPRAQSLAVFPHAYVAALALLPLILWHGWRAGWWEPPSFLPQPSTWAGMGMLDSVRVQIFHEWYRLVCSLTLHADLPHLCGNVAFGAIFLTLLARLTGIGKALWLTLLGGTLGNGLSIVLRHSPVMSMGFSTALFGSVGAIAGFMAKKEQLRRKAMLPLAAAAALLAMLGTEGENTDYAAHIAGLACGLALGWLEACRTRQTATGQCMFFCLSLALPIVAWWLAFTRMT